VNLSLGGEADSAFLRSLIEEASKRGVLFVAAAGNEPVATLVYPAADPGVVSVTASGVDGGIAPYANRGEWIDAMAPGTNVFNYLDRSWYGNGTSFSTSWVSGWAAGYMASSGSSAKVATRQTLERWALPKEVAR
jgi:serine protease